MNSSSTCTIEQFPAPPTFQGYSLSLSPFLFPTSLFQASSVSPAFSPLFSSPSFPVLSLTLSFFISLSFGYHSPPYSYNFKNSHFWPWFPLWLLPCWTFPLYTEALLSSSVWACIFNPSCPFCFESIQPGIKLLTNIGASSLHSFKSVVSSVFIFVILSDYWSHFFFIYILTSFARHVVTFLLIS